MEYEIKIKRVIKGRQVKMEFNTQEQKMCITRETNIASHIEPKKDMIFIEEKSVDRKAINQLIGNLFNLVDTIINQQSMPFIKI